MLPGCRRHYATACHIRAITPLRRHILRLDYAIIDTPLLIDADAIDMRYAIRHYAISGADAIAYAFTAIC